MHVSRGSFLDIVVELIRGMLTRRPAGESQTGGAPHARGQPTGRPAASRLMLTGINQLWVTDSITCV